MTHELLPCKKDSQAFVLDEILVCIVCIRECIHPQKNEVCTDMNEMHFSNSLSYIQTVQEGLKFSKFF